MKHVLLEAVNFFKTLYVFFQPSPKKTHVDDGNERSAEKHKETNDLEYNDDETEGYDDEHQVNGYGYDYDGEEAYVEEY